MSIEINFRLRHFLILLKNEQDIQGYHIILSRKFDTICNVLKYNENELILILLTDFDDWMK